ncbi:MAG: hypothetical protein WAV41_05455 [Microgenomates group bacterium]
MIEKILVQIEGLINSKSKLGTIRGVRFEGEEITPALETVATVLGVNIAEPKVDTDNSNYHQIRSRLYSTAAHSDIIVELRSVEGKNIAVFVTKTPVAIVQKLLQG